MLRCVGARGELALDRGLGEQSGLGDQQVDSIDRLVEVVLDGVEVAVVGIGDLRRDIALGDALDVGRSNVQRRDDGVQRLIHTLHDLAEVTLMLGCVGARGQLALDRGLGEQSGLGDQQIDGIDRLVEVVLDGVEVTVVGIGDLRGDIALGDALDVVRCDIEGKDDGLEGVVDALNDLSKSALELCGVGAGGEASGLGRVGKSDGLADHGVDGLHHA